MQTDELDALRPDWDRTALFLDFDGTLAPIVDRPEDAAMAPATRAAVAAIRARTGGAVALISGRALADLDARTAPLALPAAGSHGAEFRSPGSGAETAAGAAARLAPAAAAIAALAGAEGLLMERKPGSVTLHYRSRPALGGAVRALVERLAAEGAGLRALHGLMVSEVALAGIDKGTALRSFMAAPPFAGRSPIAAGDDTTDEDAFRAARALGGTGIKIGPGPTAASHRAPGIAAFLDWLARRAAG
ncbi:trehalose-phosphatase [Paralimibaculum aggregatum]|uniref:Trehalose 6-phosphate phosphatase n=1 Tax=Paralimibaculum aggregatum TaxID=3036245 RepID=A0ABQ6LGD0_9RHOB|nr:trehalose-phosphatase [Limibaculum sp. NKW23]GMG82047.1 trehalose-phosphatase [Limibaculum sp. NKW23]